MEIECCTCTVGGSNSSIVVITKGVISIFQKTAVFRLAVNIEIASGGNDN